MRFLLISRTAAAVALAITAVIIPISPSYAGGSEGVTDTGGGATGGAGTTVVDPSKGGTPVVCKNGKGSWRGNDDYYIKGFPGCDPSYKWMAVVVRCVVAYDEFRFYGTVSNPTKGATLSRVNLRDYCLPANIDSARTYFPNPKDASLSGQSVWKTFETSNTKGNLINLSDNCKSVKLELDCTPTSLAPRESIGEPCTSLMAQGDKLASNAINSPDVSEENKKAIRDVVFAQYKKVLDNTTSAWPRDLAASLANLPTGKLGSSVGVTSAANITALGNGYACGSAIQYIPVTDVPSTDPVQLGACIAPIYIPARAYRFEDNSWPRTVNSVTSFIDGDTGWTPASGQAPYEFALAGDWAVFNDLRYSTTPPSVRNNASKNTDSTVAVAVDVPATYSKAIQTLVRKDVGKSNTDIATADWFPEEKIKAVGFETFKYPSATLDTAKKIRLDRASAASDAAKGAACWSMRVAAGFSPGKPVTKSPSPSPSESSTSTSSGSPSPTPTETPPPSKSPTSSPSTFTESDEGNSGTSGPVKVIVTVNPKTYTVGGTSRPQTVKVTDVDVLCSGRPCGSAESDPLIVGTPQGRLGLVPTGGLDGCVKTTQRGCDMYISKSAVAGSIAGQSTTALFFSPSRKGEYATVNITQEYLKVVPKKWIPPVPCPPQPRSTGATPIEIIPCEPTPGYWTPDYSQSYIITEYIVRTVDGGSLSRPVTGTIGK